MRRKPALLDQPPHNKRQHWRFFWVLAFLIIPLLSCAGLFTDQSESGQTEEEQGSLEQSEEIKTELDTPDPGTWIGNPSSLYDYDFKLAHSETSSSNTSTTETTSEFTSASSGQQGNRRNRAAIEINTINAGNLEMGVLGLYAIECRNADWIPVLCDPRSPDVRSVLIKHHILYIGEQVDVSVSGSGTTHFGGPLETEITKDFINGGTLLVTSYLGGRLPSIGENAANIHEDMRGKYWRLCTTPDEAGPEPKRIGCGNPKAMKWDILISDNKNGPFEFFDLQNMAPDYFPTTASRPPHYFAYSRHHFQNFIAENFPGFIRPSSTSFFTFDGYFTPYFPAKQKTEVFKNTSLRFTLSLNIDEFLQFKDGTGHLDPSCVSTPTAPRCRDYSDPHSAGIYNPYYDTLRVPAFFLGEVDVEEVE